MPAHSTKWNIVLNSMNTITGLLFPVVTFPYAARILLPEGIGTVNFLNSIIDYIILLTSLGIPMYAVREIAGCGSDKARRDKTAVEIILLSALLCLAGYAAVWALAAFVPRIHRQESLFFVLSISIVFTTAGVNWFYQGIEDFKFITIRAIIIRALAACALFIFVKKSSDLINYGLIIVGSTVGNNFVNFLYLRKHISLSRVDFGSLDIMRHLKPSAQVFLMNLILSLYLQLNIIMLGALGGETEVGYYTGGTKITNIGVMIISSLSTVLLPRCANLLKTGNEEGFGNVIGKSLKLNQFIAIPMAVGMSVLAVPATMVFCGAAFSPSVPVLLLNAPVLIIVGLAHVAGMQVLYPKDKIRIMIWSMSGGAAVNVALNIILIPSLGAVGAAAATLAAEAAVLTLEVLLGQQFFPFGVRKMFRLRYYAAAVLMGCAVFAVCRLFGDYSTGHPASVYVRQLLCGIPAGIAVYAAALVAMKDDVALEIVRTAGASLRIILRRHP